MIFSKYEGAGNDFIIIDNRENILKGENNLLIEKMCNRRFGIGADGLLLLQNHNDYDFEMRYFNADGFETEMCGNGARCIVKFAREIGIIKSTTKFLAGDGSHKAIIEGETVSLEMKDIDNIINKNDYYLINTGVPHYVCFRDNIKDIDVYSEGKRIRDSSDFQDVGVNVNFVELDNEGIKIRTYERGVEDETLACGTGIVASVVASSIHTASFTNNYIVKARGGILEVSFIRESDNIFRDICLKGPAKFVFKGEYFY